MPVIVPLDGKAHVPAFAFHISELCWSVDVSKVLTATPAADPCFHSKKLQLLDDITSVAKSPIGVQFASPLTNSFSVAIVDPFV